MGVFLQQGAFFNDDLFSSSKPFELVSQAIRMDDIGNDVLDMMLICFRVCRWSKKLSGVSLGCVNDLSNHT
jgi:hypothetical protein